MSMRGKLGRSSVAAASLVTFMALQDRPASAQLSWDWGGGDAIGGSGRQMVAFNPQYGPGQIIVSFGDRKLYLVTQPGQAISYPIAVPREKSRWEGVTTVSMKRESPSWTPTPAMLAENPRLPRWVPGGHPLNPLGVRALYLGSSAYRIHGTDAPWTIGTAASKGCIRLYNQDVLDLYPRVNVGTKVTVTYQTFTTTGTGAVNVSKAAPQKGPPASFFMFGDDDPVPPEPMRRARTKSKSSAAGKGKVTAGDAGEKVVETRAASEKTVEMRAGADKNAAPAAPAAALDPAPSRPSAR
jgi:hypothetical protein